MFTIQKSIFQQCVCSIRVYYNLLLNRDSFFKYFHTLYKSGFCDTACSCEDKIWIKSEFYKFTKYTFPKLRFVALSSIGSYVESKM